MGRIPMSEGWTRIPEGDYIFGIYDATYDENFGKVVIKLVTAAGQTHGEQFSILKADGSYNDGALGALSNLARNALNDYEREDFDPDELVGRYLSASVYHTESESKRDPGKKVTYAHLRDYEPADGFDKAPTKKVAELMGITAAPAKKQNMFSGLGDILNS